jgi:ribosomal protein L16 Arg81 hydroxylase
LTNQLSLLYPVSENDFFANYFEKKSLHITRKNPSYFDSILKLVDIDALIASNRLDFPMINMIKKDGHKALAPWISRTNYDQKLPIDKDEVYQQISNGQTLTVNTIHRFIPKLHNYLFELGARWGVSFAANAYITPSGNQGFDWHYDNHDVFILQMNGTKSWDLEKNEPFLPDENYKSTSPIKTNIKEYETIILKEGDTLYIPRGLYHRAIAENESSVHLTIGFSGTKNYQIFEQLLQESYRKKEFRQSILSKDIKSFDYESILNLAEEFVLDYFKKKKQNIKKDKQSIEYKVESKIANDYNRLSSILKINSLNPKTLIQLNTFCTPKFYLNGDFVIVNSGNKEWQYPKFMEETLKSILSGKPIKIEDIEGIIAPKHKLELIKKFITNGVVKII